MGLEIVDSVVKQDITKTNSKSGISCTCLGAQHLEEELGLIVRCQYNVSGGSIRSKCLGQYVTGSKAAL